MFLKTELHRATISSEGGKVIEWRSSQKAEKQRTAEAIGGSDPLICFKRLSCVLSIIKRSSLTAEIELCCIDFISQTGQACRNRREDDVFHLGVESRIGKLTLLGAPFNRTEKLVGRDGGVIRRYVC